MPEEFASLQLNTEISQPLWRQLYMQLDDMLNSGVLREGASLPPERDLAEALGVSRSTVKRSYDQLRHDQRVGGRGRGGSVVRRPPERVAPTLGPLRGFTEEMRELGKVATTRVLECAIVSDRRMASIFQRPSNAQFLHVARVREADGVPMTRELAWYDLTLAPDMATWDGSGSAYERLRAFCKLELGGAEQSVEAILSSPLESEAFGFDAPQPCLLFKRMTRVASGALVEYVEGTFRGDAYVYRIELQPESGRAGQERS
ncbi:GntR family transcriptional regulator [Ottowia sp.]|uniref:GntR family transcriptional regulator n=1 Tax=Ottowia sp. TaxID=1898956 RepID=UPI002D06B959|nr:GntR family transcriptional regulator [Ottowia sp.]HRN76729.1 GntR family transcriptional regulator [Ottowia sp.]HRQ03802.1 GntR family transcriptional regulator [Ottowia sp.]